MLKINRQYPLFFVSGLIKILILFVSISSYAQPIAQPVASLDANQPKFNLKQANKTFDQLNLQLSVENLNVEHLEAAITTLNNLIDNAKISINFYQKKLNGLDNLIKEAETTKEEDKAPNAIEPSKEHEKAGADLVYLKQEQKNISDQMAQYRLFTIRAQEAITTYQTAITKIKQQQVLTRGLPLLSLLDHLQKDDNQTTMTFPIFAQPPVITKTLFNTLCIITMLCIVTSIVVIKKIKSHALTQRLLRVRQIGMWDGLLLFACLIISCLSLYWINTVSTQNNTTTLTIYLLVVGCTYFWALAFINMLFKSKIVSAAFYWYSLDCCFFKNLLIFLLTYYSISQIGTTIVQTLTVSDIIWQLAQIIFLSTVVITIVGFVYYFGHTHRHIYFIRTHQKILQRAIASLFVACGILNILGYHQMAIHLMYASITTCAILFSLFLLVSAIQKIYLLCAYPSPIYRYIIGALGYKSNQTVIEFIILKITTQIIIFSIGIYLIGQTWGYGTYYLNTAYSQLLNGIHFASFTFYPTRIVAGILIFCVLYLTFRSIATKFSQHLQFEEEEEAQVAVASILIYIGFTCALVAALLVSGIDFTGLAIVAGALSVGIGMGLQSIVNNFVSGIILLIEKPIKSGDHINIDNIEGWVKKIRIRSTHITTSAREDIIIPNSDLITKAVINYMYTDRYLSISCEVGVMYDSDPILVQKLLLQAVSEHDEIIKTPRSKANVLFQSFGDSGMIFQLWFLIKDGNKKSIVRSDVNFTIDRLFREHHIKIAHPQRDINVKLSEIPTKTEDK